MKALMQKQYEVMQITLEGKTFKELKVAGTLDGVTSLEDKCGRKILVFDTANLFENVLHMIGGGNEPRKGMVLIAADPYYLDQLKPNEEAVEAKRG